MSSMQTPGSASPNSQAPSDTQQLEELLKVRGELIEGHLLKSDLSKEKISQYIKDLSNTFKLDEILIVRHFQLIIKDLSLLAFCSRSGCLGKLVPDYVVSFLGENFGILGGDTKLATRLLQASYALFDLYPSLENFKSLIDLSKDLATNLLQDRLGASISVEAKHELLSLFLADKRISEAAEKLLLPYSFDSSRESLAIKSEVVQLLLDQAIYLRFSCIPRKGDDAEIAGRIIHSVPARVILVPSDRPAPSRELTPALELELHRYNAALLKLACRIKAETDPNEAQSSLHNWSDQVTELFNCAAALIKRDSNRYNFDLLIKASRICVDIAEARLRHSEGEDRSESCFCYISAISALFLQHERKMASLSLNPKSRAGGSCDTELNELLTVLTADLARFRLDPALKHSDLSNQHVFEALADLSKRLFLLVQSIEALHNSYPDESPALLPTITLLLRTIVSCYLRLSLATSDQIAENVHKKSRINSGLFIDFIDKKIRKRITDLENQSANTSQNAPVLSKPLSPSANKEEVYRSVAQDIALFERFIGDTDALSTDLADSESGSLVGSLESQLENLYERDVSQYNFDSFMQQQAALAIAQAQDWYPNFNNFS